MLNIYFKFTTEKKLQTQNFDFLSFKSSSAGHFLGSSNAYRYNWISKPLVATLKSVIWEQKCACVFFIFILKGVMTFQSQRVHDFCWTKQKL